jgi:hypothetical protein
VGVGFLLRGRAVWGSCAWGKVWPTLSPSLIVSFSPIAQPEDGPIKGPKHVVVSLILH